MQIQKNRSLLLIILSFIVIVSCKENALNRQDKVALELKDSKNKTAFISTLEKHLNAVSNKDIKTLRSTMSPEGKMQLILPSTEIINKVEGFMQYHEDWFRDTSTIWTFETKILNTEIDNKLGFAITEIVYREPERNGEPYFNRMIVSYALERLEDKWYVIKDHASSVEKSTDQNK